MGLGFGLFIGLGLGLLIFSLVCCNFLYLLSAFVFSYNFDTLF